ncbi:translation repressor protein [archaeon]|nr:translation repressor protein [archaeon]
MDNKDKIIDIDFDGYVPVEISISNPDDFLKIRETLTRIGIASRKDNTLYQSCHILHKKGRYFIVHFKELFILDGKPSDLTTNDLQRRNTIAKLLQDWNLLKILNADEELVFAPLSQIKIIAFKDKEGWSLVPKYNIGKKK